MTDHQHQLGVGLDPAPRRTRRAPLAARLSRLVRAALPVVLVAVLAGYVAYRSSEGQPVTYAATSQVVLSSSTNFTPVNTAFSNSSPDRYVENQAAIVTTNEVVDRAAAALADGVPGSELGPQISAEPSGNRDVLLVTARAGNPELAARRADAVANAYAQFSAEQVQALADQAAAASANDPLTVVDIRARAATFGDGVQVIQPSTVPQAPVSPTPSRDALLVATAVFLLAVALVLALRSLRATSSPAELAGDVGGPLLGEVPVRSPIGARAVRQPGPARYGVAVQGLRFRLRDSGDASVLVTAAGPGATGSSAVLGLAAADAAQGRQVVIVDATQSGTLIGRAGVQTPPLPLDVVVASGTELDSALVPLAPLAGPHGGSVRVARIQPGPGDTADVLRKSLTALLSVADLVLVDAGGAVQDARAFALLGEVGAVVAVVGAKDRSTAPDELRRCFELAGRDCDGVLVTHRRWFPPLGRGTRPGEPPARPVQTPRTHASSPPGSSAEVSSWR